jgi:nucleoid-associated protein YgaU
MTSDAKIGLLLGLVFIFVIAFIINGVPGLHHKDDSNKLTANMAGLQSNQSGLGASERKVALEPAQGGPPAAGFAAPAEPAAESTDTRFTMTLPEETTGTADAAPVGSLEPTNPGQSKIVSADKIQPVIKPESTKPTEPKFYVVQQGDTLGAIAKKVYGELEGNKLRNINALFEHNRKTLASIDELQVGQKLVVPPLTGSSTPAPTPAGVLSGPGFTKVDSVGQRHLTTAADKPTQTSKTDSSANPASVYVVQEGDSLWQIAADRLGDGNRYKDIVKLNSDVLTNEDTLEVGMQLKLPAR